MRFKMRPDGRHVRRLAIMSFLVLLTGFSCMSCKRATRSAEEEYPEPRFPRYLLKTNVEDLLSAARIAVRQTSGRAPLGKMQSGQKVWVLIPYGQDMRVWEAIKRAWSERGVEAQAVGYWELMGITKEEFDAKMKANLVYGNQGWKEMGHFRREYLQFLPENIRKEIGEPITDDYVRKNFLQAYLDKHPEIQYFFAGRGGGGFWQRAAGKRHEHKFMGNWTYISPFDLLSRASEFPPDVWQMVYDKIIEAIPHVSEVTFTDPEGTRLHWTLTAEEARRWSTSTGSENHMYVYPDPMHSTLKEGIIRGCANHTGFYPTMTVHLDEHGFVRRVEGGGKAGELFRMLVNHPKLRDARFPTSPKPGYWVLAQDGFATNPKYVRKYAELIEGGPWLSNDVERDRAGVQHFAFSHPARSEDPRDIEYAQKNGIPLEHTAHIHNYFPTVRWRLRDTGEWITIAEKGYVKAFDNPEVRALAAKYGSLDLIFRYEWVPSIPGINVPGDYERDYGSDPWRWIVQEWEKIRAGTYEHYVQDYSRPKW